MTNEPRRYTLSIEVEVREQDDFDHFQPNTVVVSAPQLGVGWVSGNDREALRDFFRFFVRKDGYEVVPGDAIAARALEGDEGEVERLRAELEMRSEAWGNSVDVWLDERKQLLAEVERLKAAHKDAMRETWHWVQKASRYEDQNAAMLEIVQAVAKMDPVSAEARTLSGLPSWRKDAGLIAKARAILAQQPEGEVSDVE